MSAPGGLLSAPCDYAGTAVPDLVAMLRVDQAWGLFQALFAAHDNHAAYYGGTEITGHPSDKWGWAGQLALSIKNIPTGPGDTINVQGVYTDGATRYNIQDLAGGAGANTIYGGSNVLVYQSIGLGVAPDTVFIAGGRSAVDPDMGYARCVHPQLDSGVEHQRLRCLRPGHVQRRS